MRRPASVSRRRFVAARSAVAILPPPWTPMTTHAARRRMWPKDRRRRTGRQHVEGSTIAAPGGDLGRGRWYPRDASGACTERGKRPESQLMGDETELVEPATGT